MAWNNEFIQFTGRIEGHTQKAVRFCGDNWIDFEWVPLWTKKNEPIARVITMDHDSGEATIEIAKWLVEKNEGWK